MPQYFRIAAVAAIGVAILAVIAGFYNARSKSPFRLKGEHAQLSTDVISEISGYERLETENGVTKHFIKADYAKTFSDNHQELQNVYFELYDDAGIANDKMRAESALYIPEENKNFTAYLKGGVQIETRDGLMVQTNHIKYARNKETAEADELVEFARDNIRGKSFGAVIKMADKRIDLLKDVEIETFESAETVESNVRYAKMNSASASFDQNSNRIDLTQNVAINIVSKASGSNNSQTTEAHANRAVVNFAGNDPKSPQLKTFELFEAVRITSIEQGALPTNIESGYALYDKDADRFELKNGAHIITAAGEKPTEIRASEAIFERAARKVALTGGAGITQGSDNLKGDTLHANLFSDNTLKDAVMRGNASARQTTIENTTTVNAPELNASFNQARQMRDANAIGQSIAEIIPSGENKEYSRVTVSAARGIGLIYKAQGLLDSMRTDGRTAIDMKAPNAGQDAANKRLTADHVVTVFNANGKDIYKTEAVGNSELYIEPLTAGVQNYRTTVNAPRFDCEFFPTGNNAKVCVAATKAKAVRVPTVPAEKRGTQTLVGDRLTANFSNGSSDIERFDAVGNAKFTELDRTATANQMIFTQTDEVVRLRGGEPVASDSDARVKAKEIDWDTKNNKSYMRGGVSTTYYSRKQMNDAAPFGSSDKPVYVTAETGEFDHAAETANYTGNARGWQENNYVRGNRIFVDQPAGRLFAEGSVQSALYTGKNKQKGNESVVPTYAAADTMTYNRGTRVLQYRNAVDIRQGTDRIKAGSADVYLDENSEVIKTVAQTNVMISQPDRKASGDSAEYSARDETAVLRGNPATIVDGVNGSSQGSQLTFFMRENRVISDGRVKQGSSSRTRSVYKIDPKQ